MDIRKSVIITTGLLLCAGSALADAGDRIETRLDRKGDRIEHRLDNRGDRIDRNLDRKSRRADAAGCQSRQASRPPRPADRPPDRPSPVIEKRGFGPFFFFCRTAFKRGGLGMLPAPDGQLSCKHRPLEPMNSG